MDFGDIGKAVQGAVQGNIVGGIPGAIVGASGKSVADLTGTNIDVLGGMQKALSGQAPQVAIPGAIPVNQATQTMTDQAALSATKRADAGQVNNPFRQAQLGFVQNAGGPNGFAQQLLKQQQDQNLQNALALSASTRGNVNPALMQRGVLNQVGMGNQQAFQQAQMAGLQEQAQAAGIAGQARQADIGYETSLRQLAQQYQMMGMDANKALLQAQTQLQGAQLQANSAAQSEANKGAMGMFGGLLNAVGGAIGLSDERLKTDVKDGSKDVGKFLDAINANKYRYKNKAHGDKEYISPMAQELEKTAMGKQMVIETPQGKAVDYSKGLGSMLASQAVLHERIKKLELKKG